GAALPARAAAAAPGVRAVIAVVAAGVVSGAAVARLGAAAAGDGVVAGAAGQNVGAVAAGEVHRLGRAARVDVLEAGHRRLVAEGLVVRREDDGGRAGHQQRLAAVAPGDRDVIDVIGDGVVSG